MIVYVLKSASCLALLVFFYHLILEKEKMHNFNRFYLLGSILFSFLAPLTTITIVSTQEIITEGVQSFNQLAFTNDTTQISIEKTINYTQLFIIFYIIISLFFLLRFSRNLYKILKKIKDNQKIKHLKATLVLVEDKILPHTFWKYIFINKNDYKEDKIEDELFTHELTHVTQKHTLDVLLIELLQIIFWINPTFFFIKKAIQLNHEFLADETVINQHKNTFQYQHLLINKAAWKNEYYLASNLNYLLTKKRLQMMTKQSSHTKILFKKLAVIPLLVAFIFLFAERVEAQEKTETKKPFIELKDPYKNVVKGLMSKDSAKFKKTIREKDTLSFKLENVEVIKVQENSIKETQNKNDKILKDIRLKLKNEDALKKSTNKKDTIKEPITIKLGKNSASASEMKEYKTILKKGIKDRLFTYKDIQKMKYVFSIMSLKQKATIENYATIIPPPPPPPIKPPLAPSHLKNNKEYKNGQIQTNKETLYYKKENDKITYYNRWGQEVLEPDLKNIKEISITKNTSRKSVLNNVMHLEGNITYFINGEKKSKEQIKSLDKEKIKTLSVIKHINGSRDVYIILK